MERWGMKVEDPDRLARLSGESIYKEVSAISQEGENAARLKRINQVFALISRLQIRPTLHKSQNRYFELAMQKSDDQGTDPLWLREFVFLGINLGVRIEF
jgi:hypothetical protein